MHRALRIHREERLRPYGGPRVADVDVRRVLDDQDALLRRDVENRPSPLGAERKPRRIVAVGDRVVERNEEPVRARPPDRVAKARRIRTLGIHIHAVDLPMAAKIGTSQETRVGRCIRNVGQRFPRPFEQRADQADATGRADGRNQPSGIHVDAPVATVDSREGLSRTDRPERVGVRVGFAQELRQRGRVVQSFEPAQVIEVRLLVGDEPPGIGDLGVRIAGAEMMDGQSVGLGDGTQFRQRGGHLSGHRDRLLGQRRRVECVIGHGGLGTKRRTC